MTNPQIFSVLDDMPGSPAGSVNQENLEADIIASAITKTFVSMRTDMDVLSILFDDDLTAGDETILHGDVTGPAGGLLAAHDNASNGIVEYLRLNGTNQMTGPLKFGASPSVTTSSGALTLDPIGNSVRLLTATFLHLGTSSNAGIVWSGVQENDSVVFALGNTSNTIIFTQAADANIDFGRTNEPDPTIIMQSADATSLEQHGKFAHDQASVAFTSGFGGYVFNWEDYSGTPGTTGSIIDVPAATFTDDVTAGAGTAADWTGVSIPGATLAADNAITITRGVTLRLSGPIAGTNVSLSVSNALFVESGDSRFDGSIDCRGNLVMLGGKNISLSSSTGTKLGQSATVKLGFWGLAPVVQPLHIADASGGGTIDAEARTAINALLAQMATIGLQAVS